MHEAFRKFAHKTSEVVGSAWAFALALALILTWAITGPLFHFSDTWQLVINTSTTIVTFLMVFLIQNTQNRDAKAIHLKLDELLRGVQNARTGLVDLEELSDEDLERLQRQFRHLHGLHAAEEARAAAELDERQQHGRVDGASVANEPRLGDRA